MHCVDLGESFPTSIYLQNRRRYSRERAPRSLGENYSILFIRVLRLEARRSSRGAAPRAGAGSPRQGRTPGRAGSRARRGIETLHEERLASLSEFVLNVEDVSDVEYFCKFPQRLHLLPAIVSDFVGFSATFRGHFGEQRNPQTISLKFHYTLRKEREICRI